MGKRKLKDSGMDPALLALGSKIDQLWEQREQRLNLQHRVDEMKEHEEELNLEVAALLREAKLDGAKGDKASVGFRRLHVPQLVDDEAFLDWVRRSKERRDLLKVGVNNEAWRLRLADGVAVPGIEDFVKETLSIHKAGK